ncbi:MAG: hypothetical protein C6H99_03835 [Epsilonproteobacteria bacterium]|nr:hypothetical protein [Campylobacterota bacterium]NPA64939.1 hypothetical protein [Campylobacterota bacterium]
MKKFALFLILFTSLFASAYSGFMKLEPGAWAKYIVHTPQGPMEMINKFIGTTTYKGKKVNVIETVMQMQNMQHVIQYWSAKGNDAMIKKIVSQTPQGLFCMEEEMIGFSGMGDSATYHTKTPKEFDPKKPNIKIITLTLKNGKKIKAALFKEKDQEIYVSSEVPFGIVLVKEKGKKVMELVDFGYGAKPIISLEIAKSCGGLQIPPLPK